MPHSDYILLASPFEGSYAMLSELPLSRVPQSTPQLWRRDKAVVFVHGYKGNAVTTWLMFQELIEDSSVGFWSGCDVYFYQYDSGMPVTAASQVLREFLISLFPAPKKSLFNLAPLPEVRQVLKATKQQAQLLIPDKYESLYLVGHSRGGLVIRQALMELAVAWKDPWTREREVMESILRAAEVRLFSPALFGYAPTGIQGVLYYLMNQVNICAAMLKSTSVHEELKLESIRLADLRKRTEQLAERYDWMRSMRAHLLYAEKDIVHVDRYDCDPLYKTELGHSHTSVCKPNRSYLAPLRFIEQDEKTTTAGSR